MRFARIGRLAMAALAASVFGVPWAMPNMPGRAVTNAVAAECDRAAVEAAQDYDVPLDVLRAITRVETGRGLDGVMQPWPWTINVGGRGAWFDSFDEALDRAERAVAGGVTNFDVGCFQINYGWHGENFSDVAAMFDPRANASYAARFLQDLHKETGDWRLAAGAFHSRTPDKAKIYLARFDGLREGLEPVRLSQVGRVSPDRSSRTNTYPLLRSGTAGSGSRGSLVPIGQSGSRRNFLTGS
jgi:hypothetical protein